MAPGRRRSGTEEHGFCPRPGVALNYDLIGYHIGTMNDYPNVTCLIKESHLGHPAYGAFGIGENIGAGMSGITTAAIFNAAGKWGLDYPTTQDKILKERGRFQLTPFGEQAGLMNSGALRFPGAGNRGVLIHFYLTVEFAAFLHQELVGKDVPCDDAFRLDLNQAGGP